jgi:hypothetical protein
VSADRELEAERELAEQRAINLRLQRQLARQKAKTDDLIAAVHAAARDAAVIIGRPEPVLPPPKDKRPKEECLLLHLTDFQLGKRTAAYDSAACVRRVQEAVQTAIRLTEIQRADHPVRDVHLMLGGDLVENVTIFPGQVFEVDSSSFEQVFTAAALVESVVLALLTAFENVHVYEVAGNHGRVGQRGSVPKEDNLDRLIGRIVRERMTPQPRLHWRVPTNWYETVEIGNYRALLVHGDQVSRFGGGPIPAFAIKKAVDGWSAGVVEPFLDCYMGHYHQAMTLTLANGSGRIFVSPSPEAGNEYAREWVRARGRGGQRAHFVSPSRGEVTAEYLIYLDAVQHANSAA